MVSNRLFSYPIKYSFTSLLMAIAILLPLQGVAAPERESWQTPDSIAIEDETGQHLFLTRFKGQPVLIHIWASWCGPCLVEMDSLMKMQAKYSSQGLVIIALSEDEKLQDIIRFHAQKPNVVIPLYWDIDQRMANALHINALPTSILVGKDGVQIQRFEGGVDWQQPQIESLLNQMLMAP